jgi:oxygen-independent coproporphyrinogen-3 oxidase
MNASTAARRPFDYMLNALRLVDGFALAEFEARTGLSRSGDRAGTRTPARGWVTRGDGRGRADGTGTAFTNDVISLFLPD